MAEGTAQIKEKLMSGFYDSQIKEIYEENSMVEYQKVRFQEAISYFENLYGIGEAEIYSVPGRSEIGGNHTDHQQGKVLAAAIDLDMIAIVRKVKKRELELYSEGYGRIEVSLDSLEVDKKEEGTASSLVKGVAAKLKKEGYHVAGFSAYITSDVWKGGGVSSSAAFEVLIGIIISGLYNELQIPELELARAGQYAENKYFGKPCGLMDQLACVNGGLIAIDFKENNPKVKKITTDFSCFGHSLCIVNTNGSHENLTNAYTAIRKEMNQVAAFFGKNVLREVQEKELFIHLPEIRRSVGDRAVLRAIHFFEEEKRVDTQVTALQAGDFKVFKKQVKESGNSSFKYLQNVYTTENIKMQDISVALASSEVILNGQGACRIHGGGFAGTIQSFVPDVLVKQYKERIEKIFGENSCCVLKIRKYGGIKIL